MTIVNDLPGQKLLSSHSGDLLASVDPYAVRRFVRRDGDIHVYRIQPGSLIGDRDEKVRLPCSSEPRRIAFRQMLVARRGRDRNDLADRGSRSYGSGTGTCRRPVRRGSARPDVGMLAKIANQLGIEWYCVLDDDSGRRKYEKSVRAQFDAASEADRLTFPYYNIERFLCESGFGDLYEARMSRKKQPPTSTHGTTAYWDEVLNALPARGFSKPAVALEAVFKMKAGAVEVPPTMKSILEKAIALTGG